MDSPIHLIKDGCCWLANYSFIDASVCKKKQQHCDRVIAMLTSYCELSCILIWSYINKLKSYQQTSGITVQNIIHTVKYKFCNTTSALYQFYKGDIWPDVLLSLRDCCYLVPFALSLHARVTWHSSTYITLLYHSRRNWPTRLSKTKVKWSKTSNYRTA